MRTVSNLLFQEVGQMCDVLKFWSLLNSVMLCGRWCDARRAVKGEAMLPKDRI